MIIKATPSPPRKLGPAEPGSAAAPPDAAASGLPAASPVSRDPPSSLRVLVIEDDLVFQRIIQAYLKRPSASGIEVTLAASLEAGLEQLEPERVDAVLLDLTLPDSFGLKTLHRLQEYAPWAPVIVLTGLDDERVAGEAVRRGAQDFIVKTDLNPSLLVRSIRYAVERSRAEAALRVSESRFRAVVEDQTELVCRYRPDATLTFVNRAFCRFFGREPEELLGRSFLTLPGEDHGQLAAFVRAVGRHQPTRSREQHLTPPDEEPLWIQWTDRALFDAKGDLVEFQSVGRDITEQKKLEGQLYQAQKMEALGQLAGGLAHDFNNLLTVIAGSCGLLMMEGKRAGKPPNPQIVAIEKAAMRAAALTQQLLTVSRRHVAQAVPLDLNQVIGQTEEMLRRLIREEIAIEVKLERGLGRIKADRGQIEQILVNLAINARDAMPEGGRLTIATAMVEPDSEDLAQSPAPGGPRAELTVTDTGIGMDAEIQEKIFDPFFTTKEEGKGTGLGLAIVYALVKQSQGVIRVASVPGGGTTFKIRFPITVEGAAKAPVEDKAVAAEPAGGSGTILVVEDESSVRELVKTVLEEQGYAVRTASSAEQARVRFDDPGAAFDAMVTDIVLPGRSGYHLAAEVEARFPGVGILFMSGYADTVISHEGLVKSAGNFLQKPFSPRELLDKVGEILSAGSGKEPP